MLGSTILLYLQVSPTPWREWAFSVIFSVVGCLVLRQLLWLCWPILRKITPLKKVGYRLDLILVFSSLMIFLFTTPLPLYGSPLVNGMLKLFLGVLIFVQWEAIARLLLFSHDVFPRVMSANRRKALVFVRILLVLCFISFYGAEYLPQELLRSWVFVVIAAAVLWSVVPLIKDIVYGWSVVHSRQLEEGQNIEVVTSKGLQQGKVLLLGWTHLHLTTDSSEFPLVIRWAEIYKNF